MKKHSKNNTFHLFSKGKTIGKAETRAINQSLHTAAKDLAMRKEMYEKNYENIRESFLATNTAQNVTGEKE